MTGAAMRFNKTPMSFFEAVNRRHSIRTFATQAVDRQSMDAIFDAARLAPSAGDLQSYAILRIEGADAKSALAVAAHGQDFIATAPVVLVVLADTARSARKYGERGSGLFCLQDATIAAAYVQLAAAALGLGSCWVGAFDEAAVARLLRAPPGLRPVAILPIGHAAESPARPPRRPLSELVHEELF